MDKASIRASAIWEALDCPLRFAAKHLEGMRLPATGAARIGTAVHRSTAAYDESRLKGYEYLSIEDSADLVVETIRNPDEEVDWMGLSERQAIEIGVGCHTRYCSEIGTHMEYTAVEYPLNELVIDVPVDVDRTVQITLTGTLDRVRMEAQEEYNNEGIPLALIRHGVVDVKTGARAATQSPSRHKAQLGVYELLAENTLDIEINLPAEIIALQTSKHYDVALHEVSDARLALLGTPSDPGLLSFVADMIDRERFFGNASSVLCNEKYCPIWEKCKFR